MFCYAINTTITWLITQYWKISIHMIGLGGPFVALLLCGHDHLFLMAIIIILVYISRLKLKAHVITNINNVISTFLHFVASNQYSSKHTRDNHALLIGFFISMDGLAEVSLIRSS